MVFLFSSGLGFNGIAVFVCDFRFCGRRRLCYLEVLLDLFLEVLIVQLRCRKDPCGLHSLADHGIFRKLFVGISEVIVGGAVPIGIDLSALCRLDDDLYFADISRTVLVAYVEISSVAPRLLSEVLYQ